jgi:hypothetical protein
MPVENSQPTDDVSSLAHKNHLKINFRVVFFIWVYFTQQIIFFLPFDAKINCVCGCQNKSDIKSILL